MWLVCYEVHSKTHFNKFKNEEEARKCFEEDSNYYLEEYGVDEFNIYICEVKTSYNEKL